MQIDAATRRNLELTRSLSGGREGSLLATIDRTLTGAGGRLLEARLTAPSADLPVIHARQAAVAHLIEDPGRLRDLRAALRAVPDVERALARLALDRGGPRDLAAIRDGLRQAAAIAAQGVSGDLPEVLAAAFASLRGHDVLRDRLEAALVPEPPALLRDGGLIAPGFDAELDETRHLRDAGREVIAALQGKYVRSSGIGALKIRHNNVLGYFVETPASHAERMMNVPLSETFIHRQTTASALRFTTLELAESEKKLLNAAEHALAIERRLFGLLREAVLAAAASLAGAATALAELDVAAALADLARAGDWTRPTITADRTFSIVAGRHPVVEAALARTGAGFVPNDCEAGADGPEARPLWLITGPNMAGKSTFLRQNALIAILAQAGAFVPAREASIGVVDAVFSRVGAADDLARGRSTFMVEMVETAAILNQAGPGALVILDEIGRGTATYDGLAIAWATLEHLHDANRCRTFFATHYHELTALAARLPGLRNATVAVREWRGEIVFLHELREGVADRSYGVQVARLAGLPPAVVERARTILEALESADRGSGGKAKALVDDLPLFSAAARPAPQSQPQVSAVETRLREVAPDDLSPREALDLVYELRGLLGEPEA
jgi:DNA mismatch repair protein MutS